MKIKKEIAVCILIILIIVFADIINNEHFNKERNQMDILVNDLQQTILEDKDGKTLMNKLDNKWKEFDQLAAFYIEHNELEKINLKIFLVRKNIETNDNEMTVEYLEEIKFMLNHISEKDKLKLINIF